MTDATTVDAKSPKAARGAPRAKAEREVRPVETQGHDEEAKPAAAKRVPVSDAPRKPGGMEFRHPLTGEIITREARRLDKSPYHIPYELWPENMVYEWKRASIFGQPDHANILGLERNGWRKVPADRHPEYPTELEGLVLYECPRPFVEMARDQERRDARAEVHGKEAPLALPGGFDERAPIARKANFTNRGERVATPSSLLPARSYSIDDE